MRKFTHHNDGTVSVRLTVRQWDDIYSALIHSVDRDESGRAADAQSSMRAFLAADILNGVYGR